MKTWEASIVERNCGGHACIPAKHLVIFGLQDLIMLL